MVTFIKRVSGRCSFPVQWCVLNHITAVTSAHPVVFAFVQITDRCTSVLSLHQSCVILLSQCSHSLWLIQQNSLCKISSCTRIVRCISLWETKVTRVFQCHVDFCLNLHSALCLPGVWLLNWGNIYLVFNTWHLPGTIKLHSIVDVKPRVRSLTLFSECFQSCSSLDFLSLILILSHLSSSISWYTWYIILELFATFYHRLSDKCIKVIKVNVIICLKPH